MMPAQNVDDFDVTFWVVVEDQVKPNGCRHTGIQLSSRYATKEQAGKALDRVRKTHPEAYLGCWTLFLREDDPGDVAARRTLIEEIQGLDP